MRHDDIDLLKIAEAWDRAPFFGSDLLVEGGCYRLAIGPRHLKAVVAALRRDVALRASGVIMIPEDFLPVDVPRPAASDSHEVA